MIHKEALDNIYPFIQRKRMECDTSYCTHLSIQFHILVATTTRLLLTASLKQILILVTVNKL